MIRPVKIEPKDNYKIWLCYSDQTEGIVDLSYLVDHGVFKSLKDKDFFETVRITDAGSIAWGDDIELCPDSLYLKITGKNKEDFLPGLKSLPADA